VSIAGGFLMVCSVRSGTIQRGTELDDGMNSIAEAARLRYENVSLASLSLGSGCIDVLSFLGLGDVFTSAMTGNTALLAIAIGQGRVLAASRALCSLLGFTAGVVLAALLYAPRNTQQDGRRPLTRILLLELLFLGACTALWIASPQPMQGGAVYEVIALASLSMGIQAVGARSINSSGISTIVFTTGLIHIVMSATSRLAGRGAAMKAPSDHGHLLAFAAYGCGAVVAAVAISHHLKLLVWMPITAVAIALACSVLTNRLEGRTA
jgi:uncharacterized membrane protein YoaK (UPF0700 family)